MREKQRRVAQRSLTPSAPKKSDNTIIFPVFLATMIVLMSCVTGWAIAKKFYVSEPVVTQPVKPVRPAPPVVVERETVVNNPDYMTQVDGNKKFQTLEERVALLEKNFKVLGYRAWVTAVAVNENASLIEKKVPQNYMKLDRDWKSNKVPETQLLTQDQKQDLERAAFK